MPPAKGTKKTELHKQRISEAHLAKRLTLTERFCIKCSMTKPIEEFGFRVTGSPKAYCKPCVRKYNSEKTKRHYHNTPEKKAHRAVVNRRVTLWRSHRMTVEEYQARFEAQGGVCAICGCTSNSTKKINLCVDHDHKTGVIRGLLCDRCNRGIGLLKDSESILRAAAEYLARSVEQKGAAVTRQDTYEVTSK